MKIRFATHVVKVPDVMSPPVRYKQDSIQVAHFLFAPDFQRDTKVSA